MAEDADAVKLRVHGAADDKIGPVVATFVQGPPAEECLTGSEKRGVFPPLTFRLSGSADSRKRSHRQLVGTNESLRLEARNHGEGVARDAAKYMLGVYNPKRKRMDLYPVEGGAVLGLHLTAVHGSGAAASASGGLEGMGMRERRDMVIADFGSKKKQKMERSRKANIVDVTAVAAAGDIAGALRTGSKATARKAGEAEAAAAGAGAGSGGAGAGLGTSAAKVEEALMRARVATLPPFDLSAPTPSRAYPLERIFTPALYKLIAASAHAFTKAVQEAAASAGGSEAAAAAAGSAEADADAAAAGRPAPGTVEEAVWRFGRDSEYIKDRLTRLAARVVEEAEGGGAEQEEEEDEEVEAAEEDEEESDEDADVVDSSAALARKRKQAAARKAAKAGRAGGGRRNKADDVPTFKKLCCLMYLKHLLAMHRAPEELRYRRIPVRKPGAAKGDDAAADAGAAAAGEEEAVTETRVAIPQLRFIPDPIVSVLLDTFTETRGDTRASRGLAGAALSAASGSASAAAAGAGAEGELPAVVYARTPALTDKLRAYAVVMTLAVDGYSTDVRALARDMRIVPAKLSLAYKELGCTIKPVRAEGGGGAGAAAAAGADADAGEASGKGARGAVESYSATLRVPLTFPALKLGRGK